PATVHGQLNWSGGTLIGSSLAVASDGALNLTGSNTKYLFNALTNAGKVTWSAGSFVARYSPPDSKFGTVDNVAGALWDIQCDQGMFNDVCCNNGFFRNAGTVRKS